MNTTESPNPAERPAEVGQVQRPVGRLVEEARMTVNTEYPETGQKRRALAVKA